MRIKDVMTRGVLTVGPHDLLERAREIMALKQVHHLVVVDASRVVGLMTSELLAWGEAEGIKRVEDVMSRRVVCVRPEVTIEEAANLLTGQTIGALPIVDGTRLVGIVTIRDLLYLVASGAVSPVLRRGQGHHAIGGRTAGRRLSAP